MSAIPVGLLCFGIVCCFCGMGIVAMQGSFALILFGGLLVSIGVGMLATRADR